MQGCGCNRCDKHIDPADRGDGKWHFLVGVYTGGNKLRFYFDRVAFEATGEYNTDGTGFCIGGHSYANCAYRGDVGDIRIYKGALTDDNVNQLYDYGRQTYYSNN